MTVRELIAKADKPVGLITISAYGSVNSYDTARRKIPAYFLDMEATEHSYFVYHCEPLQYILWIRAHVIAIHGYRFIALAGRHDREKIVEVKEWQADHLTRNALRDCMLILYNNASLGDWSVHGYLERTENGWYHSTIAKMSALTLLTIWPDRVACTQISVNDKIVRKMGERYDSKRTN